jgi:Na+-driven multidrug efflux pump
VRALFAWGFFVPLVYTLGIWLEGGLFGAWFAYVPYQISLSAVLIWRFRSGVWRNIRI